MTDPHNFTRAEVAAILRCSTGTIDRRIADGTLPASKFGRRVLIRNADVAAMLAARVRSVTQGGDEQ